MTARLRIAIGQWSDKGRKGRNQDFHGAMIPEEPLLSAKGIAVALADGISSSDVGQVASETAVKGFLEDFYSTSESWSVKTSVQRVLQATNSWLYAQTRNGPYRYDMDRGYVCAFSALVLKSATAHVFNVGDVRVYRLSEGRLEQITEDHRVRVSRSESYLGRALGMRDGIEIGYQPLPVQEGDTFLLATDGVYESIHEASMAAIVEQNIPDLHHAARCIVAQALANGSPDNLTVQIVRVDRLPPENLDELHRHASALPCPPELGPRMEFDGYHIVRELHHSHRSHVYLALDEDTQERVVLKVPSVDLRDDPAAMERFMMEEWIARRVASAYLAKTPERLRKRNYLYVATEFFEGQTLAQWMTDNPRADLETARNVLEQIAAGLYALHRQEMLHRDLRPANIMIDRTGTVKIIDFGAVRVAGVAEITGCAIDQSLLGAAPYIAPEYLLGEAGTAKSDLFSLGVIAYQLLCGGLPYGARVARATTKRAQRKLRYRSLTGERRIPAWVDAAIAKAVHPDPRKRYDAISEFMYDLRQPNSAFLDKTRAPLLERNPVLFWQGISALLLMALVVVLL